MADEPLVTLDAVPLRIRPLANAFMGAFQMLIQKGVPPMAAGGMALMDLVPNVNRSVTAPEGEEPYTLADVQTFAANMARMSMTLTAMQGPPKPPVLQ